LDKKVGEKLTKNSTVKPIRHFTQKKEYGNL